MSMSDKAINIDKLFIENLSVLAKAGYTNEKIRTYFGVSRTTWCKLKTAHPFLNQIIRDGKRDLDLLALAGLRRLIEEGSEKSIHFYLDRRLWKKRDDKPTKNVKNSLSLTLDAVDAPEAARIYQLIMDKGV
jgi:hypothetical protein